MKGAYLQGGFFWTLRVTALSIARCCPCTWVGKVLPILSALFVDGAPFSQLRPPPFGFHAHCLSLRCFETFWQMLCGL